MGLPIRMPQEDRDHVVFTMLKCIRVEWNFKIPFSLFSPQLERGDFLSEEWRERIANTRYAIIHSYVYSHPFFF